MTRTLLLDSDVLAYQIASAVEESVCFGTNEDEAGEFAHEVWTTTADATEGRERLDAKIADLQSDLNAVAVVVALSDPSRRYWRHDIFPCYKAGRGKPPIILGVLKKHLADNYNTYVRPGLEADDILGILATSPVIVKGERVIVSVDKDMKTIPGQFFDMNKRDLGVVTYSERDADYWHMYQTLVGDTCDGYPGCKGVGPKKATELLSEGDSVAEWWPVVVKAFEKAKLDESVALSQARIARILRNTDYDFIKKEVILWQPPE